MWYIYTVDYFSSLIKDGNSNISYNMENLEDIMLSQIQQSQRDKKYSNMTLKSASKFYRGRKEKGDCQELVKGEWGVTVSVTQKQFWNRVSGLQYEKSSIDWQGWRQIEDN